MKLPPRLVVLLRYALGVALLVLVPSVVIVSWFVIPVMSPETQQDIWRGATWIVLVVLLFAGVLILLRRMIANREN
jgi:hypothetical protein